MPINLIETNVENNFKNINFLDRYDYWIFDLDNTIYDFKLGLFRRISKRMTEYIKSCDFPILGLPTSCFVPHKAQRIRASGKQKLGKNSTV